MCALGVVLGVVAYVVKVARLVGDGVAVVVRPDAVRCVVAHDVEAVQIGARVWRSVWRACSWHRSCPDCEQGAPGLSRYKILYIYKVLVYLQTKIALN